MSSLSNADPVLVTGVAGFIGSHTSEALLARGQRVVGVDNFDPFYDPAVKQRNLADVQAAGRGAFRFVQASITDRAALRRVFDEHRPKTAIHLAAKAGVRPSLADPEGYMQVNVVGTSIVLEESARANVQRVVIASSSSVYGNASRVPFSEDQSVAQPISPYAASKAATELVAHAHHHVSRTPVACLRFFTVLGPRQRPDLAISLFLRKLIADEPIQVFGDGSSSRDYTYIGDIVAGVLAAADRIDVHGFRVWNLGGSRPITLADLVALLERVTGRTARIERLPTQPGDVERTYADVTRSRAELGFSPRTTLEEGVARQWEWLRRGTP